VPQFAAAGVLVAVHQELPSDVAGSRGSGRATSRRWLASSCPAAPPHAQGLAVGSLRPVVRDSSPSGYARSEHGACSPPRQNSPTGTKSERSRGGAWQVSVHNPERRSERRRRSGVRAAYCTAELDAAPATVHDLPAKSARAGLGRPSAFPRTQPVRAAVRMGWRRAHGRARLDGSPSGVATHPGSPPPRSPVTCRRAVRRAAAPPLCLRGIAGRRVPRRAPGEPRPSDGERRSPGAIPGHLVCERKVL
jgi:hypothetical protein